ncbi:hypothetical protein SDC9_183470 [bioreactor metagenome]|uniref:Uncharacterized protein n=1 Tax=bioreactor metagenome TaxID=1076179 RepID=A0A645HAB4_9ZZZZ
MKNPAVGQRGGEISLQQQRSRFQRQLHAFQAGKCELPAFFIERRAESVGFAVEFHRPSSGPVQRNHGRQRELPGRDRSFRVKAAGVIERVSALSRSHFFADRHAAAGEHQHPVQHGHAVRPGDGFAGHGFFGLCADVLPIRVPVGDPELRILGADRSVGQNLEGSSRDERGGKADKFQDNKIFHGAGAPFRWFGFT